MSETKPEHCSEINTKTRVGKKSEMKTSGVFWKNGQERCHVYAAMDALEHPNPMYGPF